MTGDAPDIGKVREAKTLSGDRRLLNGSSADERNIGAFMVAADGAIVRSSVKAGGRIENAVDAECVRRFVAAARGITLRSHSRGNVRIVCSAS
jgi:predicted TIM-barrel enzyme